LTVMVFGMQSWGGGGGVTVCVLCEDEKELEVDVDDCGAGVGVSIGAGVGVATAGGTSGNTFGNWVSWNPSHARMIPDPCTPVAPDEHCAVPVTDAGLIPRSFALGASVKNPRKKSATSGEMIDTIRNKYTIAANRVRLSISDVSDGGVQ
jgi:hypothetical protein